ncbi:MAG: hypothetical protein AAF589_01205, partial [Planctomycetota bacterium]
LDIIGDYTSLETATLEIDVAKIADSAINDLITATRFAFLAGVLEVDLVGSAELLVGDTFTILTADEGVVGTFGSLVLPAEYTWDVSYLPNSVVLEVTGIGDVGLPGDFNNDGIVNGADYAVFRSGYGTIYDDTHLQLWRQNYGAVQQVAGATAAAPEPLSAGLMLAAAALVSVCRRRG